MSRFIVHGGHKLAGSVRVQGSKNAAFPVIAATILTEGTCVIKNIPDIADVRNFLSILQSLGADLKFANNELEINTARLQNKTLTNELVGKLRGSILFAGPLLARFGKVTLAHPGGDAIGARPIDVHLEGFRALGASIEQGDLLHISVPSLRGSKIVLGVTSVTGTENLVLASVLAEGGTEIRLADFSPHVQDLCGMLNRMGAKIEGVGTSSLKITGAKSLNGAIHTLCADEIEAVTLCVAAAVTRGSVKISGADLESLDAPLAALKRMKVNYETGKDDITIFPPRNAYQGTQIITGVFPQLLTDEQPLLAVLATQAEGITSIHDWIYEGRQGYLKALEQMGAGVQYDDVHRVRIYGPVRLHGAEIKTPDLRGGASILIASLVAQGDSIIYNAEIIDRGYERLDERLNALGAKIERVE